MNIQNKLKEIVVKRTTVAKQLLGIKSGYCEVPINQFQIPQAEKTFKDTNLNRFF